jgi:hypothetical protein
LSCPTRSRVRTTESESPSRLSISLRESGRVYSMTLALLWARCAHAQSMKQGNKYHRYAFGPGEVSEGQDAPGWCNQTGGV